MTVARIPKCADFHRPDSVSLACWKSWLQKARFGIRKNTRADLLEYAKTYVVRPSWPKAEPPRLRPCRGITPALMGRRPFNEFRARIEAGLCDPRFVVVFGAVMWDASRLTSATR